MSRFGSAVRVLVLGALGPLACEPYAEMASPVEEESVPVCGNVVLEAGEECDPGIASSVPCTHQCTIARCGDRIISDGETCDDGNDRPGDGCSPQCRRRWETLWTVYETREPATTLLPTALAVGASDEVLVAARTRITVDGEDVVGTRLLKLSPAGETIAKRHLDDVVLTAMTMGPDATVYGTGTRAGRAVFVHLSEDLEALIVRDYAIGYAPDTLRIGEDGAVYSCGNLRPATGGPRDFRVDQLSPEGELEWSRRHTAPMGSGECTGIAIGSDRIYAAGFEEPDYPQAGFVARRYAFDGEPEWTHRSATWEDREYGAHALAVDASDNFAVAGFYRPPPGVNAQAYVAMFAPNGAPWWQEGWTPFDEAYASARALAFDSIGRLLVMGHSTFGPTHPTEKNYAAFVLEYDVTGSLLDNHLYIEPRTNRLELIDAAVDSTGAVVLLLELGDESVGWFLGVIKLAR